MARCPKRSRRTQSTKSCGLLSRPGMAFLRQRIGWPARGDRHEPGAVGQAQRTRSIGVPAKCSRAASQPPQQPHRRAVAAPLAETCRLTTGRRDHRRVGVVSSRGTAGRSRRTCGPPATDLKWTACGAVRRVARARCGGFYRSFSGACAGREERDNDIHLSAVCRCLRSFF